jgi:hypothetical protein
VTDLNLGVIGNCQIASLIDTRGAMVWTCMPKLDADPTFCRLLRSDQSPGLPGYYDIDLEIFDRAEQRYLDNTAILETTLYDRNDNAVAITDFAPRFDYLGRMFKPIMVVRGLRPVAGQPRIRIRLRPTWDYGRAARDQRPHVTLQARADARGGDRGMNEKGSLDMSSLMVQLRALEARAEALQSRFADRPLGTSSSVDKDHEKVGVSDVIK